MSLAKPFYQDAFSPVLFNSPPLNVTLEQQRYIKEILETACSDSRFAEKAYVAIWYVLTHGNTPAPEVTSLTPNSVVLGSPDFTIHVRGSNFTQTDKIVFAGQEEPTTFVSPTELTTGVNMSVWVGPDAVPVLVQSANGVMSSSQTFTFTSAARSASTTQSEKVLAKK